jgi:hypothetical protein
LQADLLRLPIIDRKRMDEACALVKDGRQCRFQWARDVELCCGYAALGWIERSMLAPPREIELSLRDGEKKIVDWGPWTITLDMKRRDLPAAYPARGATKTELPSLDASGTVAISDANSFMKKNKLGFHDKIPWWSVHNTPVISWKSANSFENWLPGVRGNVRCESIYVIIALVVSRTQRSVEEEKF